ncbi:hypothetical protein IB276_33160 [Ensifer sp. ENS04]|uniref:hypothetical protein n=1 Tax=Ensifer sp. ENS04 TaxID=2769281 RepID=UPI0017841E0F|nr:hypothetical protein [Ensifer sp. ENS04]MBD9544297.1 hypothetical protein [Ensifer sp. ENS04]
MAKKLDLAKTQFLFEDNGFTQTPRLFRRKSILMLFGKGEPIRPITYPEWHKLQKDHPQHVKDDGLRAESVWSLEEFKR